MMLSSLRGSRRVMRMIDPVALAEAARDALDRFGEVSVCAQFGHGWSCMQPAIPDGSPRRFGRAAALQKSGSAQFESRRTTRDAARGFTRGATSRLA
jgi:hypothetical protein